MLKEILLKKIRMVGMRAAGCCAGCVVFFSALQLFAAQPWYACQKAGIAAATAHDFPKSKKLFHAALREADLLGDHELAAQSILGLTGVMVHEADYASAHKLLVEAVKICDLDSQISPRAKAALHATLSHTHEGLGNLDEAAQEASRGLARLVGQAQADEEIVDLLSHLASVKVAAGDHDAAEAIATHAVAMAENSHAVSKDSHAGALSALASAQHSQGSHESAIGTANKAKSLVPANAHAVHADLKTTLGMAYAATGKHDEATAHLEEAVEHHDAILPDNHPDLTESLGRLQRIFSSTGKAKESESIARRIQALQPAALDTGKALPASK